jgi:hypothetical protein
MRPRFLAAALALAALSAGAQLATPDPDWKESEAPPPPAFDTGRLIELEMPRSGLRFGVDPATVTLSADGIVRYVVVATSSTGAVNAIYEGIRCNTAEVKVYARHNPDSGWTRAAGDWRALHASYPSSRHSLLIARTGACMGHSPNRTAAQVVKDLRSPVNSRFENDARP